MYLISVVVKKYDNKKYYYIVFALFSLWVEIHVNIYSNVYD